MSKKVMSFTLDENFFVKWKDYVKQNAINSSKLIESLLKKHLQQKGR